MNAGDTFLAPGYEDHLWMVISDPDLDDRCVVIVFFLSWQPHYDQACIVQAGEHQFVKHPTCVNYAAAQVTTNAKLDANLAKGRLVLKAPLSPELLEKVRTCAADGDLPSAAYEALRRQGFVP